MVQSKIEPGSLISEIKKKTHVLCLSSPCENILQDPIIILIGCNRNSYNLGGASRSGSTECPPQTPQNVTVEVSTGSLTPGDEFTSHKLTQIEKTINMLLVLLRVFFGFGDCGLFHYEDLFALWVSAVDSTLGTGDHPRHEDWDTILKSQISANVVTKTRNIYSTTSRDILTHHSRCARMPIPRSVCSPQEQYRNDFIAPHI